MAQKNQKITAFIPAKLLEEARKVSGKNITETLKIGLQKVALGGCYQDLLKMRGKIKLKTDLKKLREDRT